MAKNVGNIEEVPLATPQEQLQVMVAEMRDLLVQQKEDRKTLESLISQYQDERSKQVSNSEEHQPPTPPSLQPGSNLQEVSNPDFMKKMTHFQKFVPPSFEGAKDPLEAEKWIRS